MMGSILQQSFYMYFHQIEGVEFIHDSHGQTFLSTLYISKVVVIARLLFELTKIVGLIGLFGLIETQSIATLLSSPSRSISTRLLNFNFETCGERRTRT